MGWWSLGLLADVLFILCSQHKSSKWEDKSTELVRKELRASGVLLESSIDSVCLTGTWSSIQNESTVVPEIHKWILVFVLSITKMASFEHCHSYFCCQCYFPPKTSIIWEGTNWLFSIAKMTCKMGKVTSLAEAKNREYYMPPGFLCKMRIETGWKATSYYCKSR